MLRTIRVVTALVWLLFAAAVGPHGTSAQTAQRTALTIGGQVVDALTSSPVGGAEVSLNDGTARVSSASDGGFLIGNLRAGTYTVHVVRLGYESVTLKGTTLTMKGASPSVIFSVIARSAWPVI